MKIKRQQTEDKSETRRSRPSSSSRMQTNSTFAYSSRRSNDEVNTGRQLERLKVKKSRSASFWLQKSGLIVFGIVAVVSLINVLSLSSNPKIMLLDPSSKIKLRQQDESEYQTEAKKILTSSVWNKNKLTVDTEAISEGLTNKYPDLDSVSVAIPLVANRPVIYVEPSQPALVLVEGSSAFEVNTNGRAIAQAASLQSFVGSGLPIVVDQSGLDVKLHGQALSSTYVNFIEQVYDQLKVKGYNISQMSLPAQSFELDASIAGEPYLVKFNLEDNDPRQQAGTFLATINYLKSKNVTPTKYVDVRLDGRAYYL
jgi:hypothetical protein